MADLVSRKPKPESAAVAAKTIALEYQPAAEEEPPVIDVTAADHSTEASSEAKVEVSRPEPEIRPTDAEIATPVAAEAPAPTEAIKTRAKPARARQKKIEPIVEPVVSATQTAEVAPAVAASPRSFVDEMADLDAEVDALRRQLAKKLIEQNAQLRKMLARFDGRH